MSSFVGWPFARQRVTLIGLTGGSERTVADTLLTLREVLPDTRTRETWTIYTRRGIIEEFLQTLNGYALTARDALSPRAPFHLCPSMRNDEAYQKITSCLEEAFGEEFFLRSLASRVKSLAREVSRSRACVIIVPDIEHTREASWIREQGGFVIETTDPPRGALAPVVQFERPTPENAHDLTHFACRTERERLAPEARDVPNDFTPDITVRAFDPQARETLIALLQRISAL